MLHAAHNEGHFDHIDKAVEDTAALLTRDFRAHASAKGLPTELVDNLHVWHNHDTGNFHASAMTAAHQDALNEYEYGTLERAPMGIVSTFASAHSDRAVDYLSATMLHRMTAAF